MQRDILDGTLKHKKDISGNTGKIWIKSETYLVVVY